ncbi:unnamed protein product [Ceratitis capitata]|uniref:(Mediterranean fruit fly) hypothetical protein n=1 Tax=Ceratitis capitata TaxID=7213 RepID=A0A811UBI3_CERCA|nr:unnamed protein product [Ceratitis capitata]
MGMMTVNSNNNNNNNNIDNINNNHGSGVSITPTSLAASLTSQAEASHAASPNHTVQSVANKEALPARMATENVSCQQAAAIANDDWHDASGDITAIAAVAVECERLLAAATAEDEIAYDNNKCVAKCEIGTDEGVESTNAARNTAVSDNYSENETRPYFLPKNTAKGDHNHDTDYSADDLDCGSDVEVLYSNTGMRSPAQLGYTTSFASYDSHVHQLTRNKRRDSHATLKRLRQQQDEQSQQLLRPF